MRVKFSETPDTVLVQNVGGAHNHNLDEDFVQDETENYMRWTTAQTKIITTGVMNEASPTVFKRNLKAEFPGGLMPNYVTVRAR